MKPIHGHKPDCDCRVCFLSRNPKACPRCLDKKIVDERGWALVGQKPFSTQPCVCSIPKPTAKKEWNHVCCGDCWIHREEGLIAAFLETQENKTDDVITLRRPVRVKDGKRRLCCFCGNATSLGIFVRHNPDEVQCVHLEDE